ncbi:hypothetical protein BS47DRAFT_1335640 [Hydnum rufescens UP504]|uniref:BRCT domain-containing protein n=1 Tax=Hydnum rufescens UP504 TaxID=1448309 RepID=A0A9P6B9Y0_9AGAM|nr:hypothetical protein BS47DRAFT_1335640 [Hydnum rufescens UP504]
MALALGVPCVSDQWAWDQLCGDGLDWRTYLHTAGKSERLGIHVSQVFDPRWANGSEQLFDPRLSSSVRRPFADKSFLLVLCSRSIDNREMIRKVVCAAGAASAELVKSIEKAEKPLDQYDIIVFDSREKGLEIEARRNGAKRCHGIPWVKQSIIMGAPQSFL